MLKDYIFSIMKIRNKNTYSAHVDVLYFGTISLHDKSCQKVILKSIITNLTILKK